MPPSSHNVPVPHPRPPNRGSGRKSGCPRLALGSREKGLRRLSSEPPKHYPRTPGSSGRVAAAPLVSQHPGASGSGDTLGAGGSGESPFRDAAPRGPKGPEPTGESVGATHTALELPRVRLPGVTQAPGSWGRQVCGVTSPAPRERDRPGWLPVHPGGGARGTSSPSSCDTCRDLGRGGSGPGCLVSGRALPGSRRPPESQAGHPSSALQSLSGGNSERQARSGAGDGTAPAHCLRPRSGPGRLAALHVTTS